MTLTQQQVEQLLKLLPGTNNTPTEFEDELDNNFAENLFCSCASFKFEGWILDAGNMTSVCIALTEH